MKENIEYVMHNYHNSGTVVDWIMHINSFFGEESTDKFCEYYIQAHNILRENDIRNLLPRDSLSIYRMMKDEQIAFISIYYPIDRKTKLIENISMEKAQKLYRNKDKKFAKEIKKLGYSYEGIIGNWKDKDGKDTYQRDYVFAIFSEEARGEKFIEDICKLSKKFNGNEILITEKIKDKSPKAKIDAKIYDVKMQNITKECEELNIQKLEKYFSEISHSKFLFKIPYENNKKILKIEEKVKLEYYSRKKQEIIKNMKVTSFLMAMRRGYLIKNFQDENYNK